MPKLLESYLLVVTMISTVTAQNNFSSPNWTPSNLMAWTWNLTYSNARGSWTNFADCIIFALTVFLTLWILYFTWCQPSLCIFRHHRFWYYGSYILLDVNHCSVSSCLLMVSKVCEAGIVWFSRATQPPPPRGADWIAQTSTPMPGWTNGGIWVPGLNSGELGWDVVLVCVWCTDQPLSSSFQPGVALKRFPSGVV